MFLVLWLACNLNDILYTLLGSLISNHYTKVDEQGDAAIRRFQNHPMPRLLELFLGTGSVGRAFAELGWKVVSLDFDPKAGSTICANVCSWKMPMWPATLI